MKVGIDLSSTNTGLVILDDNNKLIFHGNFQLGDNEYTHKPNTFTIARMLDCIRFKNPFHENIILGVELADFKNANITNRFNMLFGCIGQELNHNTLNATNLLEVRVFNSNEGQRFLLEYYENKIHYQPSDINKGSIIVPAVSNDGRQNSFGVVDIPADKANKGKTIREMRKALSRAYCFEKCADYQDTGTEDECDAYCIAYFLQQLRDRTQMHQEVKVKKVQAKKSKVQELRAKVSKEKRVNKLKDIVIKYKSMEKLTKAQDRALDNAIKELKELKNEKAK